jgi:homoserine kinase
MTESRFHATAFAPATVANVACGFDVLGLALAAPGDRVTVELTDEPGLSIASIEGDEGRLSKEPERNTATVAARKLLERHARASSLGVRFVIRKGLPLASGMGSSAASAVAAAVAVRELLSLEAPDAELLGAALEAERVVAGAGHPDNAAACLFGGLVLVREVEPLDLVRLPIPDGLSVAILRPHLEMSTKDSRILLGSEVSLQNAVRQWANVGALVAGLYSRDLALVSRSLEDAVAEPIRAPYIPGFAGVKQAALDAGALGSSLSGSGPSIFALCRDLDSAGSVSKSMAEAFAAATNLGADLYVSTVCARGARVVAEEEPESCAM